MLKLGLILSFLLGYSTGLFAEDGVSCHADTSVSMESLKNNYVSPSAFIEDVNNSFVEYFKREAFPGLTIDQLRGSTLRAYELVMGRFHDVLSQYGVLSTEFIQQVLSKAKHVETCIVEPLSEDKAPMTALKFRVRDSITWTHDQTYTFHSPKEYPPVKVERVADEIFYIFVSNTNHEIAIENAIFYEQSLITKQHIINVEP